MKKDYLKNLTKQFVYYKVIGEKTFDQLSDQDLNWQANDFVNSIGTIVQHMSGNMLSRFTDFMTSDGEKTWRKRDQEFSYTILSRTEVLDLWENGWNCLLTTLDELEEDQLFQIVYIRNQGHTVSEALDRQLAHYAYHVGQIVFIGKMLKGKDWKSLSIPKGDSKAYNASKFSKAKQRGHFTDEFISNKIDLEVDQDE